MATCLEDTASELSTTEDTMQTKSDEVTSNHPSAPLPGPSTSSSTQDASNNQTSNSAPAPADVGGAKQESDKKPLTKRTPNDFIFGKLIGEGSYSSVSTILIV